VFLFDCCVFNVLSLRLPSSYYGLPVLARRRERFVRVVRALKIRLRHRLTFTIVLIGMPFHRLRSKREF